MHREVLIPWRFAFESGKLNGLLAFFLFFCEWIVYNGGDSYIRAEEDLRSGASAGSLKLKQ